MSTARSRYEQFLVDLAADYRPQRQWAEGRGIYLIIGHFFVGVAGGAWVYGVLFAAPATLIVAYLLAALGGLAHLLNLARPERFWRMMTRVKTSWVARGFWGLLLFLLGGLLYLPPLFAPTISWSSSGPIAEIGNVLAWAGAVLMIVYMGFVYSTSKGIPFWHSPLHPILYIAYALRGGAAALLTTVALLDLPIDPQSGLLKSWIIITAIVIVLWAFELHTVITAGDPAAKQSVHELFRGRLILYVYVGILVIGLLIPVLLVSGTIVRVGQTTLAVVGLASIAGDFFIKFASIKAGVHRSIQLARP